MPKPIHVLVLDDDRELLFSIRQLFDLEPYEIFTTTHPFEALGVLSREPVKVVISDQRMPMVSGANFLKEVKDNFPDIIRILFTGHADTHSAEDAVNKGQVFAFFSKPCEPDTFIAAVRRGIAAYDAAVETRRVLEGVRTQKPAMARALNDAKASLERLKRREAGAITPEQERLISDVIGNLEKVSNFLESIQKG